MFLGQERKIKVASLEEFIFQPIQIKASLKSQVFVNGNDGGRCSLDNFPRLPLHSYEKPADSREIELNGQRVHKTSGE